MEFEVDNGHMNGHMEKNNKKTMAADCEEHVTLNNILSNGQEEYAQCSRIQPS